MSESTSETESVEARVLDAAKELLRERTAELSDVQTWTTGTEIAMITDLDKEVVFAALTELGESGRLHVNVVPAEHEIEVLGVDHGPGADSVEQPVDDE